MDSGPRLSARMLATHEASRTMDSITLRGFRCFRDEQQANLAPLTLLVGENSTGKTSFLAMVRALWDVAYANTAPDFKEEPYDLGTFAEIAHSTDGGRERKFEGGFTVNGHRFDVEFEERDTVAFPTVRQVSNDAVAVRTLQRNGSVSVSLRTQQANYDLRKTQMGQPEETWLFPLFWGLLLDQSTDQPPENVLEAAREVVRRVESQREPRPFASAPMRSKPHRTYDPANPSRDPEGDYVPMYLAQLSKRKASWPAFTKRLTAFGKVSGLFDELRVRHLGESGDGNPFQVLIRKGGGAWRNVTDMGYGVSQVLPLITELLRPVSGPEPMVCLLQQPEVHLHPSAQAALGTLFCEVTRKIRNKRRRQVIVETHSDYLVNRVRMDVRDSKGLPPEDVSILFFERDGAAVRIHSLRLDDEGNVHGAPPGYGKFFLDEAAREYRF